MEPTQTELWEKGHDDALLGNTMPDEPVLEQPSQEPEKEHGEEEAKP